MTSSQHSLADRDHILRFSVFSMGKEIAMMSVYWDTNLFVVVRVKVCMDKIKMQKPFKLTITQYLNRLNIYYLYTTIYLCWQIAAKLCH